MVNVIQFIFQILKQYIVTISNTDSPIQGVSIGSLYFGLVLAGLISYVLFERLLRGGKHE